jgi:hypothetical protein
MSRAPRAPKTEAPEDAGAVRTTSAPIAEGRRRAPIDRASAQAIADATLRSGFPVPPEIQAVLDSDDEPEEPVAPAESALPAETLAPAQPTSEV